MKQFNFQRFLNVARWDLTINSKFYIRAAILMIALTSSPVLLYYLFSILNDGIFFNENHSDNVWAFSVVIALIGCIYMVISSGYMFHNLLNRQGRINELTLPSTNLERFLWHVVVIVVGVSVVWHVGVLFADLLHALFRLGIPDADINSITTTYYSNSSWEELEDYSFPIFWGSHGFEIMFYVIMMMFCYTRFFCLVNAWKYRYNIPLTFLFYFILQNVIGLFMLFLGHLIITNLDSPEDMENIVYWFRDHPHTIFIGLDIFAFLLYVGIWLLTYRLYTRAQLTTKRNP